MTVIAFFMGICIGALCMIALEHKADLDTVLSELRAEIDHLRSNR